MQLTISQRLKQVFDIAQKEAERLKDEYVSTEHLLASSGNGQRPYFGLQVADASKVTQRYGVTPVFGAFVGKVSFSSLGEKAGLKQGDIIKEVNFRSIHNAEGLENSLSALTVGSRVLIVFLRGQKTFKSEIII